MDSDEHTVTLTKHHGTISPHASVIYTHSIVYLLQRSSAGGSQEWKCIIRDEGWKFQLMNILCDVDEQIFWQQLKEGEN